MDRAQSQRSRMSYHAGVAAEKIVMRHYCANGFDLAAERWRGQSGELDLIFRQGTAVVAVEVKKSKSFALAALRISPRQRARLLAATNEFLADEPDGLLTQARVDVALVNSTGEINVIENALWGE